MTDFCVLGHADGHISPDLVVLPQSPPASIQSCRGPGVPQVFAADTVLDGTTASLRQQFPLHLAPGWRLEHDKLQWILSKAEKTPRLDEKSTPSVRWRAISFIGSSKTVLLRCLSEKGCTPDTEGTRNLEALPDTFNDFIKLEITK